MNSLKGLQVGGDATMSGKKHDMSKTPGYGHMASKKGYRFERIPDGQGFIEENGCFYPGKIHKKVQCGSCSDDADSAYGSTTIVKYLLMAAVIFGIAWIILANWKPDFVLKRDEDDNVTTETDNAKILLWSAIFTGAILILFGLFHYSCGMSWMN